MILLIKNIKEIAIKFTLFKFLYKKNISKIIINKLPKLFMTLIYLQVYLISFVLHNLKI
jgi:hypothetical protein